MAAVTGEVHVDVESCEFNGFRTAVYRVHQFGSATHGIDREATRIAEHIEHATALGVTLEQRTVFALIYKESRLLTTQPVNMKFQAILHGRVILRMAVEEPVFLTEVGFEGQRRLALVIDILYATAHHLKQGLTNFIAADVHTHAMCLNDGRFAIAVDNETRQVIALTVNEAVGVVEGIVGNTDGLAHFQS